MTDAKEIARWGWQISESEARDPYFEVWKEMKEKGEVWGGRAAGGRGVRPQTGDTKNLSLEQVSISFDGVNLIESAVLRFNAEHRYGLIGENGTGKSTLLRRIALGSIPGILILF